jgi:alkanesulfonate monooxygenase SsuD/methylene tetrahydromethanopterin reductase-like flavin-dependent oxidoreductase (luciferase family)
VLPLPIPWDSSGQITPKCVGYDLQKPWSNLPATAAKKKENPIFGSPQECADRLSEFASAGADVVVLQPVFDFLEHAELLAADVIPLV